MVFKKMMRAFGVGGPSVDTVLANPNTRPGLNLDGQVRILGGDHDATIEQVVLGLVILGAVLLDQVKKRWSLIRFLQPRG